MSIRALQDYAFSAKYARYIPEKKRRETWSESVSRVKNMMLEQYEGFPEIHDEIEWAYEMMRKKRVLGSQRALQFGGEPCFKHNARVYNCLTEDSKFITHDGVRSFEDFVDGEETVVLTHKGNWMNAVVKQYGISQVNEIVLKKNGHKFTVKATPNHRWILKDGSVTENLKEGENLYKASNTFGKFDFDKATPDEQIYWCYGFVYGDGTINNNYSMLRLCGNDSQYESRFTNLGFKSSSSLSLDGDVIVYTGKYKKTTPDPSIDSPELIRAFVAGYLAADGTKSRNNCGTQYIAIQSSDVDHIEFIRKCFPIAGVWIISEEDLTGQETNFGIRPYTIKFRISDNMGSKCNAGWKVESIKPLNAVQTWCLEVEEDRSFVMPNGVVTGNCVSSYSDRLRFFQECMYLLLCGCGTGFSVQKHHIEKLPTLHKEKNGTKKFVIPDTIEGWSDAIGILVSSYFEQDELFPEYNGKNVTFDYTHIRPAGSPLSYGGKAPGPDGLKNAISNIKSLLDNYLSTLEFSERKITPIIAYDIVMHAADAVISGGVRRSATICVFSPEDEEMAKAKTGNWFNENPQRGRSNNSALLIRNETTKKQFEELMQSVREFGEPGFLWADSKEFIVNPCVTNNSLISTPNGLKTVEELIDVEYEALVDGKKYKSGGFWWTGDKQTIVLEFESGRTLEVTPNHKIMTTNGWMEANQINLNDSIVIHNHRDFDYHIEKDSKEYATGYLLGSFIGDGNISKGSAQLKWWGDQKDEYREDGFNLLKTADMLSYNHKESDNSVSTYSTLQSVKLYRLAKKLNCFTGKENKHLNKKALSGNASYLSGLIGGYFDADGTVSVNPRKGSSLRIGSVNIETLRNLQIALNYFGIYSKIYQERREEGFRSLPDGNGGYQDYYCQTYHELTISCDNISRFNDLIHIRNTDKKEKINQIVKSYNRLPNRTNFTDRLVNKTLGETQPVYDCTVEEIHAFDCDGLYVHNCVEIGMYAYDEETGLSGWQGCNLSTINVAKVKNESDFLEASRAAAIIGTLQAGFTSFPYLGEVSERIFRRESLLGVSGTGWMENVETCLQPELQKKGAKLVKKVNRELAKKININAAARTTCVKPEGTASCILGTSSGIHPHHAKRYIRRVQANKLEEIYKFFNNYNKLACEESVWSANDSDEVISFCVEVPAGAKTKNQIGAVELLEVVKSTQQNWVIPGTNKDLCTQPWLVHNVSNTINVKPEEWDTITEFIFKNRKYFAGISLLSISGDKDYPQAPFTAIYTPTEMVRYYGDVFCFASGIIEEALNLWEDNLFAACDSLLGIVPTKGKSKRAWVERCKRYANNYNGGDLKKLTYCMKDINNYKTWLDLNREYVNVDYSLCFEENDSTNIQETVACSGNSCELI